MVRFKPKIQSTSANQHGTKVILNKLRREQTARTKKQIKEYLSSMYRHFISKNRIEIRVDNEKLNYEMPPILNAPFFHEVGVTKSNKKD